MPVLLPQSVKVKYAKLGNAKIRLLPLAFSKITFLNILWQPIPQMKLKWSLQDLSTGPQIKRAPCPLLQLSASWAVSRAREDSCSKQHAVCTVNKCKGRRGGTQLHVLGNDIHKLSATSWKKLELGLSALGWKSVSPVGGLLSPWRPSLEGAQYHLNRDLSS